MKRLTELLDLVEASVKPVKGEYGSVSILKKLKADGVIDKLSDKHNKSVLDVVKAINLRFKRVKRGKEIIFSVSVPGEDTYTLKYPVEWEQPDPIAKPSEIMRLLQGV